MMPAEICSNTRKEIAIGSKIPSRWAGRYRIATPDLDIQPLERILIDLRK